MSSDLERVADRARLARELHDGIAQDLVGVGYTLDLLLANPEATAEARSQLRTLRFTITELIDKVRREIYYLRQTSVLTLAQGIKTSAQTLLPEVNLNLNIEEVPLALDSDLSYEVHRIAQEILRNIAAHAHADRVTVSFHHTPDGIELCITDDGVGGAVDTDTRYGMRSISDRAREINGSLELHSDANGTRISLKAPLEDHADR